VEAGSAKRGPQIPVPFRPSAGPRAELWPPRAILNASMKSRVSYLNRLSTVDFELTGHLGASYGLAAALSAAWGEDQSRKTALVTSQGSGVVRSEYAWPMGQTGGISLESRNRIALLGGSGAKAGRTQVGRKAEGVLDHSSSPALGVAAGRRSRPAMDTSTATHFTIDLRADVRDNGIENGVYTTETVATMAGSV